GFDRKQSRNFYETFPPRPVGASSRLRIQETSHRRFARLSESSATAMSSATRRVACRKRAGIVWTCTSSAKARASRRAPDIRRYHELVRSHVARWAKARPTVERPDPAGVGARLAHHLQILAFAERVLPSASNLWIQSSLPQSNACSRCSFRT